MNWRRIPIGPRPQPDASAEQWIRGCEPSTPSTTTVAAARRTDGYTARLTIDVTPSLRGLIKVAAFHQGRTVADVVRALLEREFGTDSRGEA
jgi:hypothetical protein